MFLKNIKIPEKSKFPLKNKKKNTKLTKIKKT